MSLPIRRINEVEDSARENSAAILALVYLLIGWLFLAAGLEIWRLG